MVDAVVTALVNKLLEELLNGECRMFEFDNMFKKMKEELPHMKSFLKDVDKVRMKDQNESLKTVVQDLRELLYKAENIIEDCLLQQRRRRASKCMFYFSLSQLKYRYQMERRLSQINQEIVVLRERMKTYLHSTPRLQNEEHVGCSQPTTYPILMNDAEVVGLDDDLKKIKQWIMEEYGPLRVIGIAGMGGIGKTTLAEKIQNDGDVKVNFDHVLLVTVSQSFNFEEAIKIMLRKLNKNADSPSIDVRGLLEELHGQLNEKRYLVILDDVWTIYEKQWWESLNSALPQSNKGCCVIVTTRNVAVAQSMGAAENHILCLQVLSVEESWSLFAKMAFSSKGGECPSLEIERIGKDIVSKCGGLPLAIKVTGRVMLGKGHSVHEWKQTLEHLKEELRVRGEDENIIAPLQLSYEELPAHLKPCMLSFAIFPEDCEIYWVDMAYWWIGEGFAKRRSGKTAFETGREYFDELISRGLLLGGDKDPCEKSFITCRIHDMVRDMIIKIAKEENFLGLDDRGMPCPTDKSRRIGFLRTKMDQLRETNSHSLRTIIARNIEENEECALNVRPILCQLKWLRILSISFDTKGLFNRDPSKVEWWGAIGSLWHLIFIQIKNSCLDKLPDSIGNLQNLQVLHLINCRNLKRLPATVKSLEKLSRLDLHKCHSMEFLPNGIGKLCNLESFWGFKPANTNVEDGCRLSDLKMLTQLRRLYLVIDSEDQLEEGGLKVLLELKQLECLIIEIGRAGNIGKIVKKVNSELPPLQKLEELHIYFYPGERTPAWLNPTTLPNLQILGLFLGKFTSMSTAFFGNNCKVWELEILLLNGLYELEEDWLRMKMAMPSLRLLKILQCPNLKSHPFDGRSNGIWRKEEEDG